jgi:hypothetical protein
MYQSSRGDEDRSGPLKIVSILCLSVAVISVGLRLVSSRILRAPLKADDWVLIAALVGSSSCCCRLDGLKMFGH